MLLKDKRVDAYIDASAEFAKPILSHLRLIVQEALPDATECIKWNFPNYTCKGKIICSMAAFKHHCAFTFWNAKALDDKAGILERAGKTAMGQLGKIRTISDLPDAGILKDYLREAASKLENG